MTIEPEVNERRWNVVHSTHHRGVVQDIENYCVSVCCCAGGAWDAKASLSLYERRLPLHRPMHAANSS